MYISKVRVINYKSFQDSGKIEFKPGINIIVGQNNAGKTALLEAISRRFNSKPHRNKETLTSGGESSVELIVSIDSGELNQLKPDFRTIIIPQPQNGRTNDAVDNFNNAFTSKLNIKITINNGKMETNTLSHELYNERIEDTNNKNMRLHLSNTTNQYIIKDVTKDLIVGADYRRTIGYQLIIPFIEKTYRFDAERPNLGISNSGVDRELTTNASNLAQVLNNLQTHNYARYERFVKNVSEIIPSVKWVSSVTIQSGTQNEIRIWSIDKQTEREDLAISLSECGTGIGQVLAILYVLITSREPRTIIIDEPNSFLHPLASKKLIQILNKFPQHQYFISTHSPEILATAKPSTITMLKYEDGETKVEQLNLSQGNDKLKLVEELGMEISDFFFAENVLWVEGPTEAKAFPIILENCKSLFNFVAVALVHTDDLKDRKRGRKHAKTNIENIRRLSGEYALTPPKVFTVLDREDTSEQEILDLEKLGIKFIPQRMYENYLIDAEAITDVLNSEIIEGENKVTTEQVSEWIEEQRKAIFFSKKEVGKEVLEMNDWIKKVHAAELLEKLFSELSESKVEYRKTTHSVQLTQWFLENKPEQLKELQDFLLEIIKTG